MDKKKPKLTYEEQLKKLQELKINYDEVQTDEVLNVLKNSSYFFKVTSYRKNYEKINGCGYNVDFNALQDLAKLDMKLRYTLLPFCLDVEHSIKTFLMRIITNDDKHDGYHFVEKVVSRQPNPEVFKKELFRSVSRYEDGKQIIIDEFQKYYEKTPIWLVLEFATVNKLKPFIIELLKERPNNKTLNRIRTYIYFVGLLRNECAHNTPLIFDLKKRLRTREIYSNAKRDNLTDKEIQMGKLISIYAVLKLHLELCSDGMKIHQAASLKDFLKRLERTVILYEDNLDLMIFFNGIEKIFKMYIYSVDGKR